jgi:hypothetical protein
VRATLVRDDGIDGETCDEGVHVSGIAGFDEPRDRQGQVFHDRDSFLDISLLQEQLSLEPQNV